MARRILPIPNARRQFEPGIETRRRKLRWRGFRRRRDFDDGGVPVEPDKPRDLTGGAAAALEFDD